MPPKKAKQQVKKRSAVADGQSIQQDTSQLLKAVAAHLTLALHDSEAPVGMLGEAITDMAGHARAMDAVLDGMLESDDKRALLQHSADMTSSMNNVLVAFQFYDRLSQRLQQITDNLSAISELLDDSHRVEHSQEWQLLREMIKSRFSVMTDVELFEAILAGKPLEEALAYSSSHKTDDGSVELF